MGDITSKDIKRVHTIAFNLATSIKTFPKHIRKNTDKQRLIHSLNRIILLHAVITNTDIKAEDFERGLRTDHHLSVIARNQSSFFMTDRSPTITMLLRDKVSRDTYTEDLKDELLRLYRRVMKTVESLPSGDD